MSSRLKVKAKAKNFIKYLKGIWKQKILVIGDSHVKIFTKLEMYFPDYSFDVTPVSGASISGLKNPNSVTQAMPIFEMKIRKFKGKICVINLGEVDTGFVIWYRVQKHGISVNDALNTTILNYIDLIKKIPNSITVICISSPLPTIQDSQDWGEVANLRKEIT